MYTNDKIENVEYKPETGCFMDTKTGRLLGRKIKAGYVIIYASGKRGIASRLAFSYMGVDIGNKQVDHINHDRADNRWINLRLVTPLENNRNKSHQSKYNTSGYTGVTIDKRRPENQRFRAQVMVNKKQHTVGRYPTAYEAHLAVVEARIRLGFHENHGKVL